MSKKNQLKDHKEKRPSTFVSTIRRMLFGSNADPINVLEEEQMTGPIKMIAKNFFHNKIALFGMILFSFILLCCIILPFFFPIDLNGNDVSQQNIAPGMDFMKYPKELNGNVKQISVGGSFSVGLSKDGKVYQWGKISKDLKKIPNFPRKVTQVSAGMSHAIAMDEYGQLYTWGFRRMGLGTVPMDIQDLSGKKQIVAGYQISFVLTEDGHIHYWGNDNLINMNLTEHQGNIDKLIVNNTTVLGITKDGKAISLSANANAFDLIPQIDGKVVDIAMTNQVAVALTEDGRVYSWGESTSEEIAIPATVTNVKSISSGIKHFSAVTKDGKIISWGNNKYNQAKAPKGEYSAIYSGSNQNYAITKDGDIKTFGLKGYLMGTDFYGRDVFSRLLTGGRMTMTIGAISVIIATIIGVIIGGLSGYYGGKVDMILMRVAEVVGSLPFLPFAMILSVFIGNSISETARIALIMVILGVLSWPGLARLVRAQILAEREKEFVTAAKAVGIKEWAIIFKHIMPNVIAVIIVSTTLSFASSMLTESSLSFLGFGVVEPSATWGNMLTGSQSSTVLVDNWWRWLFPAIALSISTISINVIGDGLQAAIDPKSNDR